MTVQTDNSTRRSGLHGNGGVSWRLMLIPVLLCLLLPVGVSAAPSANFTGTPLNGTAPLAVTFTDSSTGVNITNWSWNFGDGNVTNLTASANPLHIYTTAGLKNVTLTVTNTSGPNSTLKTGYINVTAAPAIANFTGTPLNGSAPLGVTFTDLSTGTGITNWSWNFGDGNVTNLTASANPFHVYTTVGLKNVNLTVTNATGSFSLNRTSYINVTFAPAVANFTGTPLSGTAPLGVTFTDLSTGTGIANWSWNFGDGNVTNFTVSTSPFHIYATAGLKSVNLTITNATGSISLSRTDYINVTNGTPNSPGTNVGVFRNSSGNWYLDTTKTGVVSKIFQFGTTGDRPVVGDWDNNGVTDVGVFRPSNGNWFLDTNQSSVINKTFHFGTTNDTPVVGDWDGNNIADTGVFRPSNGNWFLDTNQSGVVNKTFHFGTTGDIPVVGDWNHDGMDNVGVFRTSNGNWFLSTNQSSVVNKTFHFGTTGDIPVVGDWDGNGMIDTGVFRTSNGNWFLDTNQSSVVNMTFHFGTTGDIPVVGDWNNDGMANVGVFRPSNGNWYLDTTNTGVVNMTFHFGTTGDTPIVGEWI